MGCAWMSPPSLRKRRLPAMTRRVCLLCITVFLAQLLDGRTLEVSARIRLVDDGTRRRRPRLRVEVDREHDGK